MLLVSLFLALAIRQFPEFRMRRAQVYQTVLSHLGTATATKFETIFWVSETKGSQAAAYS